MVRFCNLCAFPLIRINKGVFGLRCINCRSTFIHRAIGYYFKEQKFSPESIIHEFSNHGAFMKFLKKGFENLTTSEFFDGVGSGEHKDGILDEDIQCLSFKSSVFDIFTATEVFEHIPNDIKGFSEIYRCLKPGGHFIFTVPLNIDQPKTIIRASLINGKIVHFLPLEYHGDHLRKGGILAFRNYGMDIEQMLLNLGFSYAKVNAIFDPSIGVDIQKSIVPNK
jgi:SAM-dependent methyltransferase